ncbi:hypothetical protein S7711_09251 [Stachybotrys chartarum IBT 7711]|uniref:Reelin domain-containing protein n=1 Tax=Stachybotrys chartarum (strain CBS 109288 / IBT 7711) TaxID=1280523 RepID=A0A084AJW2_STACB|nr:hypothetical protein S7711_09251 [Stachybotrys chartarum IBT 7711]KFA71708.1 hypothetical protein S40288_08998 [Stachybotrys chartarum IBT 40288]
MMLSRALAAAGLLTVAAATENMEFVTYNGQIFTPGFACQLPETLHISLDVTANGQLPLELEEDSSSRIHEITVFLYSYETGRNFTVSNATDSDTVDGLGSVMAQEPGSTVKHINWVWPDCLVGNGQPNSDDSDRGAYNISIRQSFRLNGEEHYTIFDVPISVTNSIEESEDRPPCDILANELLAPEDIDVQEANAVGVFLAPDDATNIEFEYEEAQNDDNENGLGSGATHLSRNWPVQLMPVAGVLFFAL